MNIDRMIERIMRTYKPHTVVWTGPGDFESYSCASTERKSKKINAGHIIGVYDKSCHHKWIEEDLFYCDKLLTESRKTG